MAFSGAAGEIRSQHCRAATRTAGDKRPTGAFFRFAHTLFESLIQKEKPPPCWVMAFSVITQHYRFFISADYLLPDMELQQKEQLQTQDQHEHADHQKRYVHQKQKAHPAYLLPQGKTPHQYGHSIFAGF